MSYKIVIDSCGELTKEMKECGCFKTASLTMQVDNYTIIDDETFDQADFLAKVAASPNSPKSACPSPESYREAFDCGAEHVYAVTLSARLSGSYNSAALGLQLLKEEKPYIKGYVFNSRSASIGETLIGLKIQEYEEAGLPFEEIVEKVEAYIESQNTWFILENLETLRKNGRLSKVKAFVATTLNIKPVMMATPEGEIVQMDQARGMNKALHKMIEAIAATVKKPEEVILAISHCNCAERAAFVKAELQKRLNLKRILVLDTAGISSMYANDGGIIIVA